MNRISTPEALLEQFSQMNIENSVKQILIPGTGKFTVVFQGTDSDHKTIESEVEADPELKKMIQESKEDYKNGQTTNTRDLIKSLRPEDFSK